jgi:hypothetical protein
MRCEPARRSCVVEFEEWTSVFVFGVGKHRWVIDLNAACLPALLDQRRRTATKPRPSSAVRIHLAIPASLQPYQEEALISVELGMLSWNLTCLFLTRER